MLILRVLDKGLLHDREWMFADEKGKFITQRRYHKLALVHPKLVPSVEYPTVCDLHTKPSWWFCQRAYDPMVTFAIYNRPLCLRPRECRTWRSPSSTSRRALR